MTAKAYFLVTMERDFCTCQSEFDGIKKDLEDIPEVRTVESVDGPCDLLLQIEAPLRAILVADKILPKKWVKRLLIMKVEPFQFRRDAASSAKRLMENHKRITTEIEELLI